MNSIAETQAANYLFTVQEDGGPLTHMQANLFQTLVAKIIFFRCQPRPDLKTELDFLTTRVRNTDKNNYKKLSRTIRYSRKTRGMELTLEEDSINSIRWWIDDAYGVHPDLKGHYRSMILLGKCTMASK